MKKWSLCVLCALSCSFAQTRLNLSQQSTQPDFSAMTHTRPVQVGGTLPANCGVGELFFKSGVLNGSSLYGCVATNLWNTMSGTVTPGFGLVTSNNALIVDTAVMASKANLQSGSAPYICTSSSNNGSTYAAVCASTLPAYAAKQTLFWYADVANTGSAATLNIDTLGDRPLVKQDGSPLTAGDIRPGTLYRIWYDGSSLRVVEAGAGASGPSLTVGVEPLWSFATISGSYSDSAASSNKNVVACRATNPYNSLTITQITALGYSGVGKGAWGIYTEAKTLIQQSATASLPGAGAVSAWTFPTPAVVTGASYWVAFTVEDTSTVSRLYNVDIKRHLDALATGLCFVASTPATQPGGMGTSLTMPGALGSLTRLTGDAGLPWVSYRSAQ